MRIWFDTEFIEDGKTIELLSIGMVREDGETYYAECSDTDRGRADGWVQDNVIKYLAHPVAGKPRAQIAAEIIEFVGPRPEFWAYYADYDWVVLCQMYGRMIDLPAGWPMYCRDLKQLADETKFNLKSLPGPDPEHHALADAQWAKSGHEAIGRRASALRPI